MPIPSKGNNTASRGKSSTNGEQVVELVIKAKDEASQPFGTVGDAVEKLKKQVSGTGKVFSDLSRDSVSALKEISDAVLSLSSKILPILSKSVDTTKFSFQRLWDISVKTASGISTLLKGFEDLYSILSSPPSVAFFGTIAANAEKLVNQLDSVSNILRNIGSASNGFLQGFSKNAQISPGFIRQIEDLPRRIDVVDKAFLKVSGSVSTSVSRVQQALSGVSSVVEVVSGFSEPLDLFESIQDAVGSSVSAIAGASEQIFFFTSAIDQLKGVVLGGPFDLLIGQNIRLKEQLLSTQATLAATASYSQGGQRIDSTTQSILALASPLKQVIGQIRKDSLELVGVTSNELVESFQLVTQSMTDVNINLKEAGKLSVAFAASLGTLGIPLYQARQEIQSILQGQIDQNSALAKSIGLTNAQLKSWVGQDKVYERLTERLDAFVKGNKLASRTVGGLVSNIQELGEELGRSVGDKYLTSIESLVGGVYDFLVENQDRITSVASKFLDQLVVAFGELRRSLLEAGEMLAPLGQGLSTFLAGALIESIEGFAKGISLSVKVLSPFLTILGEIAKMVATNPLLPLFIQLKVLGTSFQIASSFAGKFLNTIPLLGEGLFLLKARSLPAVNAFSNLSHAFKGNIAAAVSVGAALTKIPGAMGLVQSNIKGLIGQLGNAAAAGKALKGVPFFGGSSNILQNQLAIEVLSSSLASFTPQLLGFAKTGLSIASSFGIGREEIGNLSKIIPDVAAKFADMTGIVKIFGKEIDIKGIISEFAPELEQVGEKGTEAFNTIDQKLSEITKSAGDQIRQTINKNVLWATSVYLVATATSKLAAENEQLKLAIEYIVDLATKIGGKIGDALFSRIGLITQAVLGLSVAFASGLIPALIQTTKSFIKMIAVESPTSFKAIIRGYRDYIEQLKNGNLFQKKLTDSVREGTEAIQKQVEAVSKFTLSEKEVTGLRGLRDEARESKRKLQEKKAALGADPSADQLEDIRKEQEYYDGVRSELRERAADIKKRRDNFKAEQRAIDPAALEEADDLLGKTPSRFGYSVPGDPRPSQKARLKEAQDKLAAAEAKAQGKKLEEKKPVEKPKRNVSREEMSKFLRDPSQVPASFFGTTEGTIDTVPGSASTSIVPYQGKKKKPRVGDLGDGIADVTLERKRALLEKTKTALVPYTKEKTALVPYTGAQPSLFSGEAIDKTKTALVPYTKEKTALVPYTGAQPSLFSGEAIDKSKKSIGQLFSESSEGAKRFASQVKTSLVGGFNSFNQSIKNAGISLRSSIQSAKASAIELADSLKTGVQAGLTTAKASAIELADSLKTGVQAGLTTAKASAVELAGSLKTGVQTGLTTAKASAVELAGSLKTGVQTGLTTAKASAVELAGSLKTGVQTGLTTAKASAVELAGSLKTGVQTGLTTAKASAIDFATALKTPKASAIELATSLKTGVQTGLNAAKKSATELAGSLKTGVQTGLNAAKTSATELAGSLKTGVQSGLSDAKASAIGLAGSLKSGLANAGKNLAKQSGIESFHNSLKNVGKSLKTELQIGLTTARASAIELATSLKAGVQTGITAAGAGLTALGQAAVSAGVAVKALLIEFAPLIAIGAAIGVVVTALTNWAAGEQRKNAGIKEYNERLKETITSLEEIKRLYNETEPPETRLTPETGQELQARDIAGDSGIRKLRALREGRNPFEWAAEGISAKLGGGDIRSIQNDVISAQRSADAIETELADRLASDPFAKDGSGLNPEVMAEVRRNQELSAEIALLNKQGKDDQARLKQGELESSSRRLSDLEKRFSDNKEYLKGLDLSGEDAQRRDAVVDKLTYALNQLAGVMEGTIAPMKMIEQGTGTALNLTQFNQAKLQFSREGAPDQLERYASLMMGSAGELVQQGQLDPEDAIDAVRKLAESTGLDAKTTKAAQEQMAQFWEIATKRILQAEENRQSGLDLLRQRGQVSEKQYLEESLSILETKLQKQKEMSLKGQQQEIEVIKVQEREQLRVIRQQLQAQEETLLTSINNASSPEDKKKLTADLNAARADAGRQEAEIIKATQDEIRQLRLDYESEYTAMMIAAEKERQDARIKIVQEMQDKLNDQLAYSEEMRNQNLTRLTNENLIFEEEANLIRTESTDRRLAREIEAEKAIRNERMKTPALFESEIRKSDVKIAQLTQQRIENEGKAWDAQIAVLRRNLKYRVDLFVNAIEEENKALLGQQKYIEAMQDTLNTRNEVLGSAKGIVDETTEAIAGSYNAAGAGTLSENTQKTLQNLAEIAKLETLQKSVELEKQMFETQLAQNRLALERQEIELKLKQIEEQRLTLEKKAALEVAQKAAEEKPGDRQAQLEFEKAKREYELQLASFGLTTIGIQLNQQEQDLADVTNPIRIKNNETRIQNEIAQQQATVAKGGNPLQQYEMMIQSQITSLSNAFGISKAEAERLARDPDALYQFVRNAQQNGIATVAPELRGQTYSFNDYTSNRGAQQTAVLNTGARFGATSIPGVTEAGTGYDAVYGTQVPMNPTQTGVGSTFDEVNAALDSINLLDETVTDLGKGAIPTMEEMTASAATLIDEQFPAFKEAMDEVSADKLPTATSVLDELGARLQTFSEEDLPGMQEALTGVQDTAIMGIDTIVLKLEEETTNLTEAIAKQFETVWQDILTTIVLPPSGNLPEDKKPEEQPVVLTPEQQAERDRLRAESEAMVRAGNKGRLDADKGGNAIGQVGHNLFRDNPLGWMMGWSTPGNVPGLKMNEVERELLRRETIEFVPTQPASGGQSKNWWNRQAGGNDRAQVSKTFTANIVAHAKTVAEGRAIGEEIAVWMRDVFYKTNELTA